MVAAEDAEAAVVAAAVMAAVAMLVAVVALMDAHRVTPAVAEATEVAAAMAAAVRLATVAAVVGSILNSLPQPLRRPPVTRLTFDNPMLLGALPRKVQRLLHLQRYPQLAALAVKGFSKSTWNARLRVLRAMNSKLPLAEAALRFINKRLKQGLTPGTVAKDIGHIKWILQLEQVSDGYLNATMAALQKALRTQQAVTPVSKALPMTREFVRLFLQSKKIDSATKVDILLSFKAGARVSDTFALRPDSAFQMLPNGSMLICWGVTKTHRTVEARPDHQQIIDHPGELTILTRDPTILRQTSSTAVRKALRTIKPPRAYVDHWQRLNNSVKIRRHFTLHSMKRGRAAELWTRAAEGTIPVATVLRELKHKSIEAALAYGPSPAATALAIRRAEMSTTPASDAASDTSSRRRKRWSRNSR